MRAEQVYDVAWDIKEELKANNIVELVTDLASTLEQLSTSPSADVEGAISVLRTKIEAVLLESGIDKYPPSRYEIIEHMKITSLFGNRLQQRINNVLTANQVTPSKAAEGIKKISQALTALQRHATNVVTALSYFEIGTDDLNPGEFELMVVIPGRAIDNELGQLGREATRLNKIIGVFSEIATGSREPVKIRAIASSDPTFFLESPYATAALIAAAIERIAKVYSQIQGIVKTHREMKALGVPKPLVDGMMAHIEETLKKGLDEIAKSIEKQNMKNVEAGRKNEIKAELNASLYEIARRLDEGYIFDVHGEDVEDEDEIEGEASKPSSPEREAFKVVQEIRPRIQHFKAETEPVLGLSKPKDIAD